MRCIVCDYCDTEGSLYRGSLIDPKGGKQRTVFIDPVSGHEICSYCYVPPFFESKRRDR